MNETGPGLKWTRQNWTRQHWTRLQRPLAGALLCGALLSTLSGCVELMVGSAVVGTVAASDRRTFGAQAEDRTIEVKGAVKMPNVVGSAGHVNINSFNRQVLLTGEVRDAAMKAAVEREVAAIDGVKSVANELAVTFLASFTSRSNDTLITGKVKASLIDMKDISAYSFKVVTERGTVYLMGRVTRREGRIAGDIARGVGGVQKVMKLFEYITDDEGRSPEPAAVPAAS